MSRHLARHLEWCRLRNLRSSYVETRRRTIVQLERELGKPVEEATERDLVEWHRAASERMVPAASCVYLSHVQCYFRWLTREKILSEDPTCRLIRPRLRPRLPRPMNDRDLEHAINTASARVRPWLLLAAFAGLRAIEIAGLRAEDVDLSAGLLIVMGKGGKERPVPIHPLVREALLPLLGGKGYLFAHWDKPGPPTAHNVSYALNHHLRREGITATAHTARHWFLTMVYRASKDLRLTQELAGHASPNTTAQYAKHSPDQAPAIVNGLSLGTQ